MAHPTTSSTERALSVTGRPQCPAPSRRSADPTAAAALTNGRRKHRRNCPHARTQAGKKKRKKRKEVEGRTSSTRSHHGRQPPQQQHFRTHHDAPPPPPLRVSSAHGFEGKPEIGGRSIDRESYASLQLRAPTDKPEARRRMFPYIRTSIHSAPQSPTNCRLVGRLGLAERRKEGRKGGSTGLPKHRRSGIGCSPHRLHTAVRRGEARAAEMQHM